LKFEVTRVNENRLDIEMSGKLDSTQMGHALDVLVGRAEGIENGRMLYEVVDYRLPSLGARRLEFSRLPRWRGLCMSSRQ